MGQPSLENQTPYAAELLFGTNEQAVPIVYVVAKATFALLPSERPQLAEKQLPVCVAGEYYGDPDTSSYRYEPEIAFRKIATDVCLIGHAYPAKAGEKQVDVTVTLGKLNHTVRVFGPRTWVKRMGLVDMTPPAPLEKTPLQYELAFGGWDAIPPDPFTSRFEPRNPVGVGFKRKEFVEGMPLPQLENPRQLLKQYGDTPPPTGFGFISPGWQPRAALAGTYDQAWQDELAPLLPADFDPRFYNAANPQLISEERIRGDETVEIRGATPNGRLSFQLPGVAAPVWRLSVRRRNDQQLPLQLDTLIVDTDQMQLIQLWRAHSVLPNGPHDVLSAVVSLN